MTLVAYKRGVRLSEGKKLAAVLFPAGHFDS